MDEEGNNSAAHVYFNADKIFNLIKGYSVGCMTWGDGSIGNASIASIAKDFRENYYKKNKNKLKTHGIEIGSIANSFKKFIEKKIESSDRCIELIGFIIAAYSKNKNDSEIFLLEFMKEDSKGSEQINKEQTVGINWFGEVEYTSRLLLGISTLIPQVLLDNDFDETSSKRIMNLFTEHLQLPIGNPAMPIQDAIDFTDFLVDFNCKMSKFMPGAQIIEVQ